MILLYDDQNDSKLFLIRNKLFTSTCKSKQLLKNCVLKYTKDRRDNDKFNLVRPCVLCFAHEYSIFSFSPHDKNTNKNYIKRAQ